MCMEPVAKRLGAISNTLGSCRKTYLEAGLAQQGTPGSNATRSPTLKPLTSSPMSTTVLQPS